MSGLKKTLTELGINKTKLAKELKISRQALYGYLSGHYRPRAEIIRRMARILEPMGVSIWDILPESENEAERL